MPMMKPLNIFLVNFLQNEMKQSPFDTSRTRHGCRHDGLSLLVAVDGLEHGVLVEVLSAVAVEQLPDAVLVVVRVPVLGNVVEGVRPDPLVPVSPQVGFRGNVGGPDFGQAHGLRAGPDERQEGEDEERCHENDSIHFRTVRNFTEIRTKSLRFEQRIRFVFSLFLTTAALPEIFFGVDAAKNSNEVLRTSATRVVSLTHPSTLTPKKRHVVEPDVAASLALLLSKFISLSLSLSLPHTLFSLSLRLSQQVGTH